MEKDFDRISRHLLWSVMKKSRYPQQIMIAIKSLYILSNIVINTGIKIAEIKTNQGLRQECSLSHTLSNIYINDLIKNGNQ
jgi:hypothetical protein